MENLCQYKIKVKGTKLACKKLVSMTPIYEGAKEIIFEDGLDDDFSLVFSGNSETPEDILKF